MKQNDPYIRLAERYDWMAEPNPARKAFFRRLFAARGVRRILDCACGTGNDLVIFHGLGLEVTGSDVSDAMLAQAHMKTEPLKIPLKKADFRNLPRTFHESFDAVVCLGNAVNELLEDDETHRALVSMRDVLRKEGILVIDQGQTDRFMKQPPRYVPVVNDRDRSRLFWIDYAGDIQTVHIFDFIHTKEKCGFEHASVRIRIRLLDGWESILARAGFSGRQYFGDWKSRPYDRSASMRLIIVANR